jgi:hypothetical protein
MARAIQQALKTPVEVKVVAAAGPQAVGPERPEVEALARPRRGRDVILHFVEDLVDRNPRGRTPRRLRAERLTVVIRDDPSLVEKRGRIGVRAYLAKRGLHLGGENEQFPPGFHDDFSNVASSRGDDLHRLAFGRPAYFVSQPGEFIGLSYPGIPP